MKKKEVILGTIRMGLYAGTAIGTGLILGHAVNSVVSLSTISRGVSPGKLSSFLIGMGSFGLGGLVGEKTADWTTKQFDDVVSVFDQAHDNVYKMKAGVEFHFETDEEPKE